MHIIDICIPLWSFGSIQLKLASFDAFTVSCKLVQKAFLQWRQLKHNGSMSWVKDNTNLNVYVVNVQL